MNYLSAGLDVVIYLDYYVDYQHGQATSSQKFI